ncbi:hypothetical protein HGRIS_001203 [Hohenbuehelia grisea]|uniref:Uncharacterized protein n=1 Tax=Hohenbuehelia grisea TaxID=104357 RepID=A0ABR3JNS4_9AGAR
MTADVRTPLRKALCAPHRVLSAPDVPMTTQTLPTAPAGFRLQMSQPNDPDVEEVPPIDRNDSEPHSTLESITTHLAASRAQPQIRPVNQAKKKNPKTCQKCGSSECKGQAGVKGCANPYQDCGAQSCRGRDSKRPKLTCKQVKATAK